MKKFLLLLIGCSAALAVTSQPVSQIALPEQTIQDKIKGGWAGQTIGVTFGGPYEFRFNGTFVHDEQQLNKWGPEQIRNAMLNNAGLYDDVYMDLTFVDVFARLGLDAPVDSFAAAYANAGYMLWHANQAGRYNVLNGIKAPASGFWKNNPHADDIDFQIESDFAGLMSPGMPQTAAAISDRIGHIMNYGDGWYGGVYVATMYSLAFTHKDVQEVVRKALKAIPANTTFYQCMSDVIRWYEKYPADWHQAWYEIQKKWAFEAGCPDGVFAAFNIDAKVNAAYVLLGLLYGNGDFGKTIEIATRAGQDADCNPSTAAGILGTVLGYSKIPAYWKQGVEEAADIDFKYTTMSLNKTYKTGFQQAIDNILRNGGRKQGFMIYLPVQEVKPVNWEQGFSGLKPVEKTPLDTDLQTAYSFSFSGSAFVIRGEAQGPGAQKVLQVRVSVDNKNPEIISLPVSFNTRRHDIYWNYQAGPGKHEVKLELLNKGEGEKVRLWDVVVYK